MRLQIRYGAGSPSIEIPIASREPAPPRASGARVDRKGSTMRIGHDTNTKPRRGVTLGACFALAAGALLGAPALASPAAAVPRATAIVPKCAWPVVTNASNVNVAYPDTNATYWTTPYKVEPNTRLVVNGNYPSARFMSFNTYDSTFGAFSVNGVKGAIFDYQIMPNAGSANPWQHNGTRTAPGANLRGDLRGGTKFRVSVSSSVPSSTPNTIPLAPAGTTPGAIGFLLMRVYLPKNGNFSAVALPSISVVTASGTSTIAPCTPGQRTAPGQPNPQLPADAAAAMKKVLTKLSTTGDSSSGPGPCQPPNCPPDLQFARASAATTNSVFPNSASAYVSAIFQPDPTKVVLVRAVAPRTPALDPPGTQPQPWQSPRYQLRYFSLCNNIYRKPWPVVINKLPGGQVDEGCRADNATKLDRYGRFTYVIAAQSRAQQVSRWPDTTFIPTSIKSAKDREVLIFRNMLSSSHFRRSALNAPENNSASGAAAAMGPYYPRAVSCPVTYYLTNGPDACFLKY